MITLSKIKVIKLNKILNSFTTIQQRQSVRLRNRVFWWWMCIIWNHRRRTTFNIQNFMKFVGTPVRFHPEGIAAVNFFDDTHWCHWATFATSSLVTYKDYDQIKLSIKLCMFYTTQDHTHCPSALGATRRAFSSLILSFVRMIFVRLPLTRFPSRDKYFLWQRASILVSCLLIGCRYRSYWIRQFVWI